MLASLALIFLLGMPLGGLFAKLRLPQLLAFLLTGIILGPYGLGLLSESLLLISADLRQIALIIILLRAGLSLNLQDLRKAGRPAIFMCFVPACFEIIGTLLLAPRLFGVTLLEAAVMGTVLAAVSPAVIVPGMLSVMEEGYGTNKSIPQLILAGASVDDVFVIVLFTAVTGLAKGQGFHFTALLQIPVSILFGILGGAALGFAFSKLFQAVHLRDSIKTLLLLSVSFLFITLQTLLEGTSLGFSGLLAVMAMGAVLYQKRREQATRLSSKLSKLWVAAEVLLFVLVGATVNVSLAFTAGGKTLLLLVGILLFRVVGVYLSTAKSGLTFTERLFCMLAYIPKATVQAAIGSLPLAMGLACGPLVLTVAVVSILVTAPLGAFGISASYRRLLTKAQKP